MPNKSIQQNDKNQNNNQSSNQKEASTPKISLPKGGGAIKGIDEKFTVNPATGTGSMTIPIYTTPSRSDFFPKLSLAYDSGSGHGPFGLGWSLSIPSITRKTDKGLPRYRDETESDTFILSGAEDLVPKLIKDESGEWKPDEFSDDTESYFIKRYRPRIEGLFARIERWEKKEGGDVHWRSITKDNITSIYGYSKDARIEDETEKKVFSWLLEQTFDDKGNLILYEYKKDDKTYRHNNKEIENEISSLIYEKNREEATNTYIKQINYGNKNQLDRDYHKKLEYTGGFHFKLIFDYGDHSTPQQITPDRTWLLREDAFSSYRSGFEIRTRLLCQRILMFHDFPDENMDNVLVRSTDLFYESGPVITYLTSFTQTGYKKKAGTEEYMAKSFLPTEFSYSKAEISEEIKQVDCESLENLPIGLDNRQYHWIDLDGEGISGILSEQANGWFYKRNLGNGNFSQLEPVALRPSVASIHSSQQQFMDLAGDGSKDLVLLSKEVTGFYEREEESEWSDFKHFLFIPNVNWHDPNLRLVDLNGDGHADILITEDEVFTWYPSRAEEGFAPSESVIKEIDEENGPALVFADTTQSIYLSDMLGDGLTDILRIRNGDICYWPNLGYGRFGAKITMANPPCFDTPDQFNQNRIRLTDIDGSGTTDIIYLGRDKVSIWYNQSGNSWSDIHQLDRFPVADNLSTVMVADITGNGTACLVFSSPLLNHKENLILYMDLMGGKKPHLLNAVKNNMGAETKLYYTSSVQFYLEDQKAGKPWITKIPFPVHVVEKTETIDHISNTRLVTSYKYHHGYFDGEEREFRGFGMVEQLDTEFFDQYNKTDPDKPDANKVEKGFFVPPVHTKTWFHTGSYQDRDHISKQYITDYYQGDSKAKFLDDTIPPDGLTAREEQEACRALKGRPLRSEVYSLDDSEKSQHPFQVTKSNYKILSIQPTSNNSHAVFLAHENETLQYHYERNPNDPRISHSMVLEADEKYGIVKKAAAIVYPRRKKKDESSHEPEQQKTIITYTESEFINLDDKPDSYRIGIPYEVKTYEITGLKANETDIFTFSETKRIKDFAFLQYHEIPDEGSEQKRLIEYSRILYYNIDQSGPLDLGKADTLVLPYESYQLTFTPDMLNEMFPEEPENPYDPAIHITETMLRDESKYKFWDEAWWIPSGKQVFDSEKFYLPVKNIDPFGNEYKIEYDDYCMLMESTEDPYLNQVTAQNDYRVMQPYLLTDPNGNRNQVTFDVLGMVTASAVMGKVGETDTDKMGDAIDDPTIRMEYELYNWMTEEKPNLVHTFARERHGLENPRWQESYTYSDGFGREIQTKIQAEPGKVNCIDVENRWVGTGLKIYNNKGKPVKQFEPFFSTDHLYGVEQHGVSPIIFYDPLERVVATLHPNHTYEKVVFDPWKQETWDVNDTLSKDPPNTDPDVGFYFEHLPEDDYLPTWYNKMKKGTDEEQAAADQAIKHAGTPAIAHLGTLGRPFLSIVDNGLDKDGIEQKYNTRTKTDIEGNPLEITDARGNTVMSYRYDIAGRQLFQNSMDAGKRWVFPNIMGNPVYAWDNKKTQISTQYDKLHRPTHLYVKEPGEISENDCLAEQTIYGEEINNAKDNNLLGQVYQQYDGAGIVTNIEFDFKGNPLEGSRQLLKKHEIHVDWSKEQELEEEVFISCTSYDALNRPTHILTPHTENIPASKILPGYNEANLLDKVDVCLRGSEDVTPFVTNIDYNEKSQRTRIEYGNGVTTDYTYDAETFRLTNLKASSASKNGDLQNLFYTYDPVGNITHIKDEAQQDIFFKNSVIKPINKYEYDALYRLIQATGREHSGQNTRPDPYNQFRTNLPHPNEVSTMREYQQNYDYDEVGNILQMIHQTKNDSNGNWKRRYQYAMENNRLYSTCSSDDPKKEKYITRLDFVSFRPEEYSLRYDYDIHGSMVKMPHLKEMQWDFKDQLHMAQKSVKTGEPSQTSFYVYDSDGERVKKVIVKNNSSEETETEERIYLGGFEIYRLWKGNNLHDETETLHIMDDQTRIALVETKTRNKGNIINEPDSVFRYQINNHLGSSSIELDENGIDISYEEYHPYGTTSYQFKNQNISQKRYRYTGKERDVDTGLYYHSARYYAPWLARWTAPDPAGLVDGPNLYIYTSDNPIRFTDPQGTNEEDDLKRLEELRVSVHELKREKYFDQTPPESDINNFNLSGLPNLIFSHGGKKVIGFYSDNEPWRLIFDHKGQFLYRTHYIPKGINSVMFPWEYFNLARSITKFGISGLKRGGKALKGLWVKSKGLSSQVRLNKAVVQLKIDKVLKQSFSKGSEFEHYASRIYGLVDLDYFAKIYKLVSGGKFRVIDFYYKKQFVSCTTGKLKSLEDKFYLLFDVGTKGDNFIKMIEDLNKLGLNITKKEFIKRAIFWIPKSKVTKLKQIVKNSLQGKALIKKYGEGILNKIQSPPFEYTSTRPSSELDFY